MSLGLMLLSYVHYLGILFNSILVVGAVFELSLIIIKSKKDVDYVSDVPIPAHHPFTKLMNILFTLILICAFVFMGIRIANVLNFPILSHFPEDYPLEYGCARVAYDFDHRDESIDLSHVISVKGLGQEHKLATVIDYCINSEFQSDVRYERLGNLPTSSTFYHAEFASMFFGFTDDMYIEIIDCTDLPGYISIQIQS